MEDRQSTQQQEKETEEEERLYEEKRAEVFRHFMSHFCEDCQAKMLQ